MELCIFRCCRFLGLGSVCKQPRPVSCLGVAHQAATWLVGLNLFVINGIAPDIRLKTIIWGTLPFVGLMVLGIFILCLVPDIAIWLPNHFYKGG